MLNLFKEYFLPIKQDEIKNIIDNYQDDKEQTIPNEVLQEGLDALTIGSLDSFLNRYLSIYSPYSLGKNIPFHQIKKFRKDKIEHLTDEVINILISSQTIDRIIFCFVTLKNLYVTKEYNKSKVTHSFARETMDPSYETSVFIFPSRFISSKLSAYLSIFLYDEDFFNFIKEDGLIPVTIYYLYDVNKANYDDYYHFLINGQSQFVYDDISFTINSLDKKLILQKSIEEYEEEILSIFLNPQDKHLSVRDRVKLIHDLEGMHSICLYYPSMCEPIYRIVDIIKEHYDENNDIFDLKYVLLFLIFSSNIDPLSILGYRMLQVLGTNELIDLFLSDILTYKFSTAPSSAEIIKLIRKDPELTISITHIFNKYENPSTILNVLFSIEEFNETTLDQIGYYFKNCPWIIDHYLHIYLENPRYQLFIPEDYLLNDSFYQYTLKYKYSKNAIEALKVYFSVPSILFTEYKYQQQGIENLLSFIKIYLDTNIENVFYASEIFYDLDDEDFSSYFEQEILKKFSPEDVKSLLVKLIISDKPFFKPLQSISFLYDFYCLDPILEHYKKLSSKHVADFYCLVTLLDPYYQESISKEDMDALLVFTDKDDEILNNYTIVSASNGEKYETQEQHEEKMIKKYFGNDYHAQTDTIYILKDINEEQEEDLTGIIVDPLMEMTTVTSEETANQIKEQLLQNVPEAQREYIQNMSLMEMIEQMPEEQRTQALAEFTKRIEEMNDSIKEQAAISSVKQVYINAGADTEKIQNINSLDINSLNTLKDKFLKNTNDALVELKKPLTKESVDTIIDTFHTIEEDSKNVIKLLDN